jgi:hypothetical protein
MLRCRGQFARQIVLASENGSLGGQGQMIEFDDARMQSVEIQNRRVDARHKRGQLNLLA